ncbi:hypothetical protein GCM10022285_11910 [Streptomyces tunisiensis]|uniref:Uncharacterized protein n=1 Tax=Streptomyces tunisiensis TaxID=948699 RepID=A0ABP7XW71_9ACTN
MRAVPPSRSTTSASQWAGYSWRSDEVCMGPRLRLAFGGGARQSVVDDRRAEAAARRSGAVPEAAPGTRHDMEDWSRQP